MLALWKEIIILKKYRKEGDYYIVDEPSQSIIGKKSGIRYTIGDEVEVKAVDASKVEGTIDFELVKKKRLKYEKKS